MGRHREQKPLENPKKSAIGGEKSRKKSRTGSRVVLGVLGFKGGADGAS